MSTVASVARARCQRCGLRQGQQTGATRPDGGCLWRCANCGWSWWAAAADVAVKNPPFLSPLPPLVPEPPRQSPPPPVERARPLPVILIIEEACAVMNVSEHDLYGKCRHKSVVMVRMVVCVVGRRRTLLSFPELADALQKPNHSTTVTAHKRAHKQMARTARELVGSDPSLPEHVSEMTLEQVCELVERRVTARMEAGK